MKQILIKELIDGLKDLASYDFQKTAWFENNLNLSWSYEETVSSVFDDGVGLSEALQEGIIVFDPQTDMALKDIEIACDNIGYDRPADQILDLPEMNIVRKRARECLHFINKSDRFDSQVEFYETNYEPLGLSFIDRDNL